MAWRNWSRASVAFADLEVGVGEVLAQCGVFGGGGGGLEEQSDGLLVVFGLESRVGVGGDAGSGSSASKEMPSHISNI